VACSEINIWRAKLVIAWSATCPGKAMNRHKAKTDQTRVSLIQQGNATSSTESQC